MPKPYAPRSGEPLTVGERPISFMLWGGPASEWSQTPVSDVYHHLLSFVAAQLPRRTDRRREVQAFLTQAQEFGEAATNPRALSRPLLYYYSFLNLTKAFLAYHDPDLDLSRAMHGLWEPATNMTSRMVLTSQTLEVQPPHRRVSVFHRLCTALDAAWPLARTRWTLAQLLGQIPAVHRAYAQTMRRRERFVQVPRIHFYRDQNARTVWVRLSADKTQVRRLTTLERFRAILYTEGNLRWTGNDADGNCQFESRRARTYGRSPLDSLPAIVKDTRTRLRSILTAAGRRFYLTDIPAPELLPHSAACFAVMFYLGSISRYRPHAFHRLTAGRRGWLIHEFINTQTRHFAYDLASEMTQTQLVIPWAASH